MKEKFPYKRRKDWTSRWVNFIKESQELGVDLKLDWDSMNCLMWSCMGVEAITGYNPHELADINTTSVKEAAREIRARGYNSLDEFIMEHWEEVPVGMAQQGDVVLVDAEWDAEGLFKNIMPHAIALADPPFYWCVLPGGLGKGDLYKNGRKAFAVGRIV